MKKLLKVIIVLVFALSLFSACAEMKGTGVQSAPTPALQHILQKGELVVGTAGSMPPLNMTTKEGEIIGLEADLARFMADAMGVKLKLVGMPFHKLLSALEAGEVDMVMSGMTITPERNLKVAFIGPYFVTGKGFLTRMKTIAAAEQAHEVDKPDITLAALRGSTSEAFVKKAIPKARLVPTKDYDEAVKKVLKGEVHALVADYHACVVPLFQYPDKGLLTILTPLTYEPLGVALPGDDPHLINWVQNYLRTLEDSGELEALEERWLQDGSWLSRLP